MKVQHTSPNKRKHPILNLKGERRQVGGSCSDMTSESTSESEKAKSHEMAFDGDLRRSGRRKSFSSV